MLSLPELPPPPQLETSYSASELALRRDNSGQARRSNDRGGWVIVASGNAVAEIPVQEDEQQTEASSGAATPARSEKITIGDGSPASSVTTLSRVTTRSGEIVSSAEPAYDPIDVGDEADVAHGGQQDRADGAVDAVFRLHSGRRMKPSSTGRGVSIPSRK